MSCLSDLQLDELVREELAAPGGARAHIAGCARCGGRLKQIEDSRAAFLAEKPRLRAPMTRAAWVGGVAGAAVLAASMVFMMRVPNGERLKGGPQLSLFVRHAEKVRPAGPRETVAPGDTLQFTYASDRDRHLAVLSLDGAGRASVYFPDGDRAAPIAAGRDVPLPRATVLDTVLGSESLYGLFCDDAVELPPLRAQLEKNRDLAAPGGCSVITLGIEKK